MAKSTKIWVFFTVLLVLVFWLTPTEPPSGAPAQAVVTTLQQAYADKQSNVQVQGEGEVTRLLADDQNGARHQRIIVRLVGGQTVLIAHNIDLAPRIDDILVGDALAFYGEYEWNDKGGVVHWTHHDPDQRHVGGWLKHRGVTYQ